MILALNLIHSRIGRALRAIHGNEEAARAMGIDRHRLSSSEFHHISGYGLNRGSSLYAALCDIHITCNVSINESIMFVVMVAVGGMMNVWGAVVGTIIMTILPRALRVFHDYDILIMVWYCW